MKLSYINLECKYNNWYYLIYLTTNLVNGKYYVGYHVTKDLDDGYLGSGVILEQALKKYGYDNFKRQDIEHCISLEHMAEREIFWIKEFKAQDKKIGYNIHDGGFGGDKITKHPDYENIIKKLINSHKGQVAWNKGLTKETDERVNRISIAMSGENNPNFSGIQSKETKEKKEIIPWNKGLTKETDKRIKKISKNLVGRNFSQETLQKQKESYYKRPIKTCPHCGYESCNAGVLKLYHGDNCKQNPNRIITKEKIEKDKVIKQNQSNAHLNKPIETCPYCGVQGKGSAIHQWHFDNCRYKREIV